MSLSLSSFVVASSCLCYFREELKWESEDMITVPLAFDSSSSSSWVDECDYDGWESRGKRQDTIIFASDREKLHFPETARVKDDEIDWREKRERERETTRRRIPDETWFPGKTTETTDKLQVSCWLESNEQSWWRWFKKREKTVIMPKPLLVTFMMSWT